MEHVSVKAMRPGAVRTALAVVTACALAIACALALKAPAHAEETYTVTFGNTGKSYQVPAGKTLADVKGATIPTMPDTTYLFSDDWSTPPINENLKATFLGWAICLVEEDDKTVEFPSGGATEKVVNGRYASGSGDSGFGENGSYGACGIIESNAVTKQAFSRDGWRNAKGKSGYAPLTKTSKINSNIVAWAVYSVPLCFVFENVSYPKGGYAGGSFVKTGSCFVGSSANLANATATFNRSWSSKGALYFTHTEPSDLLFGTSKVTKDCDVCWVFDYDKSKKFPELSYKKTKLTKTYGAKAFTNPLLSITNGKTTYASSNKKVATVSSTGKVTVKGVGKTTITAKSAATSWRKTHYDGDYTDYSHEAGKASYILTVNPKGTSVQKLAKGKRSFTVSWKKLSKKNLKQITGYQVRYSTSKKFTAKTTKTKTIKASSKAGKKRALTVTKLKGGKKYYVQVRTYTKVGKAKYYSSWSKAKAVKTKK
ncbi:MAG: hypothetical protein HFJ68_00345 [Adlercreutzia caecimuris]|uniref:fibronectin type III domain-containing protein n=1 Tax=Adlercreutzia caecimuris TaxID=671266 RepID=UPI00242CA608|nr:fibronectin type III domain-containing protein [Adlercreutzia caecimuris]MCI9206995.1 hypothetical protein [Adlercreutzia caecimuris]